MTYAFKYLAIFDAQNHRCNLFTNEKYRQYIWYYRKVRCKAKKENDSANLMEFLFCQPANEKKSQRTLHTLASPTSRCSNQSLPKSAIFANAPLQFKMYLTCFFFHEFYTQITVLIT